MSDTQDSREKIVEDIQHSLTPHKGKLKIFLGAAPGVGKTYAMLTAVKQLMNNNIDVVIGHIETHGRVDVNALLQPNMEYVPLKLVEYPGHQLMKEFDIDAALNRKPAVIIVDELAHQNASGSRNTKRYQDILELLNAGIDVYTALNIQHLESLKNIVEKIINIKITETVPDKIIDLADELVLIDLPPNELRTRIDAGKVYPKESVEPALKNFFRVGNLTALREIALSKTAQKVHKQVTQYKNTHEISHVWPTQEKLLLILEPGYSTDKIIRYAKHAVDKGYNQWFVGYIEDAHFKYRPLKEKQDLLHLLSLAQQFGAIQVSLIGVDVIHLIRQCVVANNINHIILTNYKNAVWYKIFDKSLSDELIKLLPEIQIHLVEDSLPTQKRVLKTPKTEINFTKLLGKTLYFAGVFVILGLVLHPLTAWMFNENLLLIYLLVMIIINRSRGKLTAVICAFLGTLSFDFFVIPPYFSFSVNDAQYIITFAIMCIVGIIFSIMNGNLRFQLTRLLYIQRNHKLLNNFNQKLGGVIVHSQLLPIVESGLNEIFHIPMTLFVAPLDKNITSNQQLPDIDLSIVNWVQSNNEAAGLNTERFSASTILYLPILSEFKCRGVLALQPESADLFLLESQQLLNEVIKSIAITLERIHFTNVAFATTYELDRAKLV